MRCAVYLAGLLLALPLAKAQQNAPTPPPLLPPTPEITAAAAKAMQGCPPDGKKIREGTNKNGVYTLTGDLFQNGRVYALIDNKENVILCEGGKDRWNPKFAINDEPVWKYPGWDREKEGRDPRATKPFWVFTLQKHPLIAIPSYVEKQGQNYDVLLLDSKCERILDTTDSFGLAPLVRHDYLATGDASRVKATYGGTFFFRIQNDKFDIQASWEECAPYDQPDPSEFDGDASCYCAKSGSNTYVIMDDYNKDSHPANWVVFKGDYDIAGWEWRDILDMGKGTKPFAKLYFTLSKPKDVYANADAGEQELAYLFEKLTGLPRDLYRVGESDPPKGKIESKAKIKVTGEPEAVKLLSPHSFW